MVRVICVASCPVDRLRHSTPSLWCKYAPHTIYDIWLYFFTPGLSYLDNFILNTLLVVQVCSPVQYDARYLAVLFHLAGHTLLVSWNKYAPYM